jgi:ATP-dependent Clp protease ATP-binding subunit ClpC
MTEEEAARLLRMEEEIIDSHQSERSRSAIARAIRRARSGLKESAASRSSFSSRPHGVGKTELRGLANSLGSEDAMIRLDMSAS